MITGIEIERLRGIREGKLDGLTPLTVLVGPSGSGKSTVLDALLIGASTAPADAIGRVVLRRAELPAGAPWLFERGAADAVIKLHGDDNIERACTLRWSEESAGSGRYLVSYMAERPPSPSSHALTTFAVDNRYQASVSTPPLPALLIRLVEAAAGANHASLVRVYEEAFQRNAPIVRALVPSVLDGALGLRVGTYQDGGRDLPILHIEFADHSVPVAGAGSGIYAVVRLALEVAAPAGGIILVEEPEAHQHPAVIAQAANVLLEAARRGVQLVVSTHSLELIDALVAQASAADLEMLSVVRMILDKGLLRSSRFTGSMVATARTSIDEDLR